MSLRFLISAAALVVTGAVVVGMAWPGGSAAPVPVAASVNGTAITDKELEVRVATLLPRASYHGNVPANKLASLKRAALDELILDELILEELVWQDSSRQGRRAEASAVDAAVAEVRRRFESEEEFQDALREDGISFDAFRRYMARRVLVRQEQRQRSVLHTPSDGEITSYYQTNGAEFVRPEQIRLLEVLVKVDPAGGRADERKARARADAALARLRRGAPFDAVAREVSEDAFSAKGGDLGWVHRGRLDRDLEEAAFAAPVGDVRRARSIAGFHVYQVVERQPARQLTLDEARPLIVDRVQRARRDATRQAWEDGLRKSARIEIVDAALRDAEPMKLRIPEQTPGIMRPDATTEPQSH